MAIDTKQTTLRYWFADGTADLKRVQGTPRGIRYG